MCRAFILQLPYDGELSEERLSIIDYAVNITSLDIPSSDLSA